MACQASDNLSGMWIRSRWAQAGIGFACCVGACLAQGVAGSRPRKADNGAGLYDLAVAELRRSLPEGVRTSISQWPNGRPPVLFAANGWPANDADRQATAVEGGEGLEETVMARSLFAQAATRSSCVFEPGSVAEELQREEGLRVLASLVELQARTKLDEAPRLACRDACTLLRYCDHQSQRFGLTGMHQALIRELRALRLLKEGLKRLPSGAAASGVRARCTASLQAHVARRFSFQRGAMERILMQGVDDTLQLHRGRLRDMHMHVEGGFDQAAMQKRLRQIVQRCMPPAADKDAVIASLADWLALVERRLAEVLTAPGEAASVTDKATYGMAQMVLPKGQKLAAANDQVLAMIESCRLLLGATAGRAQPDSGKR